MFGHVTAKCMYWVCSLLLAVFPIAMVTSQFFSDLSGLWPYKFYDRHYKDVLIVVMTFGGLAVFDCFEIFRLLDSRLSLRYLSAVLMAMLIFLLFCVIVAQYTVHALGVSYNLNLPLEIGVNSLPLTIEKLHWLFTASSLILAIAVKIWLAALEAMPGRVSTTSGATAELEKNLPNLTLVPQDAALSPETKNIG